MYQQMQLPDDPYLSRFLQLLSRSSVCNGLHSNETFITLIGLITDKDNTDRHLVLMDSNSNCLKVPLSEALNSDKGPIRFTLSDRYEQEPAQLIGSSWSKIDWTHEGPVWNMYLSRSSVLVVQTTSKRYQLSKEKLTTTTTQEGTSNNGRTIVMLSKESWFNSSKVVGLINKQDQSCLIFEEDGPTYIETDACIQTNSPVERGFFLSSGSIILTFVNRSISVLSYEENVGLLVQESLQPKDFYICKDEGNFESCSLVDWSTHLKFNFTFKQIDTLFFYWP